MMTTIKKLASLGSRLVNACLSAVEYSLSDDSDHPLSWPPVFIIGAPRTGSTLLYQVLVSTLDLPDVLDATLSFRTQGSQEQSHSGPDVRALQGVTAQLRRTHDHGTVWITKDNLSPHPHELVREVHPGFEHLLMD